MAYINGKEILFSSTIVEKDAFVAETLKGVIERTLTILDIPQDTTEIGNGAFYGFSSLEQVNIADSVTRIGENAFNGCTSLDNVIIPGNITEICAGAFMNCTSMESVNIKDGVTRIGENAFNGCTSIYDINIPASVTEICTGTFSNCTSLFFVNMLGTTPPTLNDPYNTFGEYMNYIYVPEEALETYKTAPGWEKLADLIYVLY